MHEVGVYCCKTENKDEQQMSECVNVYETRLCNQDNNIDILKTQPPYVYGYKYPCPCHSGGKCIFKQVYY